MKLLAQEEPDIFSIKTSDPEEENKPRNSGSDNFYLLFCFYSVKTGIWYQRFRN